MAPRIVVVGTGFASAFFIHRALRHLPPDAQVIVLEAAASKDGQLEFTAMVDNRTPEKPWYHTFQFGGSRCWTGNTPRPHPTDLRTRSLYGRALDWPFSYESFDPWLTEAEHLMGIAGVESPEYPRSQPYKFPPHMLSSFDEAAAQAYPGQVCPLPSARSSTPEAGRAPCCTASMCSRCPTKAKFEVKAHFGRVFDDPRISLQFGAIAKRVLLRGRSAAGVEYLDQEGQLRREGADVVALGANAIHNPAIVIRSGLSHDALGGYLSEQCGIDVKMELDGLETLDGGQQVSGLGTMFLDHPRRAEAAGAILEFWNAPWLGAVRSRWRSRAFMKVVYETEPHAANRVGVDAVSDRVFVEHTVADPWLRAGRRELEGWLEDMRSKLPIARTHTAEDQDPKWIEIGRSEPHIQGTARMSLEPDEGVVDANLVHHGVRNLAILGASAFPSCPAANPTLLLSALSLKAADGLFA
ncbi:MAG: GMC oxidoreductase [Myxococcota bacterium]